MTATMPIKEENQPSPPGSTTCVKKMALEDLAPAQALPPGVYFSPTKPESLLIYLNRWIAGVAMPDAAGWVNEADVYAKHPDVLTRKHFPASTRNDEPSWWFLCHCKLQPTRRSGAAPRAERGVLTGGCWKLEQKTEEVECVETRRILGYKRSFGFYVKKDKSQWLMEEYTSVAFPEDGVALADGKRILPALYRMYPTPRDHEEKEKKKNAKKKRGRDDDGEHNGDGSAPMRPARVIVPEDYFDAIEALLLQQSSVGGVGQEQTHDTELAAPPDDDHTVNIHEKEMYAMPEEGQGNTDDGEAPPQPELLVVDEGIGVWHMGRDNVLEDSSWIDQHY
ncbi:hypothetical protein ACQ4PT_044369 [Festuca glaucescens]